MTKGKLIPKEANFNIFPLIFLYLVWRRAWSWPHARNV